MTLGPFTWRVTHTNPYCLYSAPVPTKSFHTWAVFWGA